MNFLKRTTTSFTHIRPQYGHQGKKFTISQLDPELSFVVFKVIINMFKFTCILEYVHEYVYGKSFFRNAAFEGDVFDRLYLDWNRSDGGRMPKDYDIRDGIL